MSGVDYSPRAQRVIGVSLLLSLAVVALPALLTPMPPLLDYPNHYARIWLLADGLASDPMARMYAADFSRTWTNIGIDLVAWVLGPIAPATVLGPLFVAAALVAPPLGAILMNRRLFGGGRWWPVAIPAVAWTVTLIAGLLNYQIGLGLALIAAALDHRLTGPVWRRFAIRLTVGLILIVAHAFALFYYAALLAALAVGPDLRIVGSPRKWRDLAGRLATMVGPALMALGLFWLFVPIHPSGPVVFADWSWDSRYYLLFASISTYDRPIDQAFMATPALLVVAALATKRLRAHGGLVVAGLAIMLLAMVTPAAAAGSYWINLRLPIMSLLTLVAAIDPRLGRSDRAGLTLATACLAVVAGRTAYVGQIWAQRQTDFRAVRAALAPVPAGAAVLTLRHDPSDKTNHRLPPGRWFYGGANTINDAAVTVPWRHAFVPMLFATSGQQPLRVLPPWTNIAAPGSPPANIHALDGGGDGSWKIVAPYAACWATHYDYALLLNADVPDAAGPAVLPAAFHLLTDQGYARLYKIARTTPPGPNPAPCPRPTF